MKKIINLFLSLILVFSLSSCTEEEQDMATWIAANLIWVASVDHSGEYNGNHYYHTKLGCYNNDYVYYNTYSEVYVQCETINGVEYLVLPRYYSILTIYRYR